MKVTDKSDNHLAPLLAAVALTGLSSGVPASGETDPYIEALDAEAQTGTVDPTSATDEGLTSPSKRTSRTAPGGMYLPLGLNKAAFERTLEETYYGSFLFYQKLDKAGRDTVYRHYAIRPTINSVRDKIMSLYGQR